MNFLSTPSPSIFKEFCVIFLSVNTSILFAEKCTKSVPTMILDLKDHVIYRIVTKNNTL